MSVAVLQGEVDGDIPVTTDAVSSPFKLGVTQCFQAEASVFRAALPNSTGEQPQNKKQKTKPRVCTFYLDRELSLRVLGN